MEYPPQITAALHEVMSKVGYVQKKGRNEFHRYNYAGEGNLLEVLRPAMVDAGLLLIPNMKSLSPIDEYGNCNVIIEYTLAHKSGAVWPEKLTFFGTGNDKNSKGGVGDKGTYKAATGANKYLLFKLFQIETGDDPEKDETETPAPAPKAANEPVWGGPLGKVQLKTAVRAFDTALHAAKTAEEVDALVNDSETLLNQVERDMPSWWNGQGDVTGMWARIEGCKRSLEQASSQVSDRKVAISIWPTMIPVPAPPKGEDMTATWKAWAGDLAAHVDTAATVADVNAWMEANKSPLKNLATQSVKLHRWIKDYAEKRRGVLAQAPKE